MKRFIAIVILFLQTISFVPSIVALAAVNDNDLYQDITSQIPYTTIASELPPSTPQYNDIGLFLNTEIWLDKHLVVYGDYLHANPRSSDIKYFHEEMDLNEAFYFRDANGNECEYRYLGYTLEGNKFPNPLFPADVRSSRPLEAKTWYAYPWALENFYLSRIGKANDSVIRSKPGHQKAQDYINAALDWQVRNAINADTGHSIDPKLVVNMGKEYFLNVDSPPTAQFPGIGRMVHKNSSGDWYQTFSIPPVTSKNQTPVKATCTILNKDELVYGEGEVTKLALIEVTAHLEDEAYFDNASEEGFSGAEKDAYEQSIYYNRSDIDSWNINLNTPGGEELKKVCGSNNGKNGVKQIFEVNLDRQFVELGSAEFHTAIYIDYCTGEKSNTATAMDSTAIGLRSELASLFTIHNPIVVTKDSGYFVDMIGYHDASVGNIANYEWQIINEHNGAKETFSYAVANSNIINGKIFNFTQDFIGHELDIIESGTDATYHFTITQRVFNEAGNIDVYTKDISINLYASSEPPIAVSPDCVIPDKAIDMVNFITTDLTDMSEVKSKRVLVDGHDVSYAQFFSGDYKFSETIGLLGNNDRLIKVQVEYISVDDYESEYTTWVYVYTSKPRLDYSIKGALKENRRIDLLNESERCNSSYVLSRYPITYDWDFTVIEGNEDSLKLRNGYQSNAEQKVLLYKNSGVYRVTLNGNNGLRQGDPYYIDIPIFPDRPPAVIMNLWNNVLSRGEDLHMGYEALSLEDDIVTYQNLQIRYDSDRDGVFETIIQSWASATDFTGFIPTELGSYQAVSEVKEEFGQETLLEFVTAADRQSITVVREFYVENLSPMTQMYVDIPLQFPEVDAYIMLDPTLNETATGNMLSKRIEIVNTLRQNSILPEVEIWDLHNYAYSQEVTKSKHTGESYPPATLSYEQDGYVGILPRERIVDDDYKEDNGEYETKTFTKTVSDTKNSYPWEKYDADGKMISSYSPSTPTMSYSKDGYSGTLRKTGASDTGQRKRTDYADGSYKITKTWIGYYSGTVSKTEEVWVSDWDTVHDYTGYYTGIVQKDVKQPFSNIFRDTSYKYVIYITEGSITGSNDVAYLDNISDSKMILVSSLSHKNEIENDYYLAYTEDFDALTDQILGIIADDNPYNLEYTLLLGADLTVRFSDTDAEDDPLVEKAYQVVHEPGIFDNHTGLAHFAKSDYNESNYLQILNTQLNLEFDKKGLYTIYRRVKDAPVGHEAESEFSNIPELNLIVHEKPIADFELLWEYNFETQVYDTTWVDLSYDPDFQFSREDKGITDRKIKFREAGESWAYRIPEQLSVGDYELEYIVQDVHGAWSDPKVLNFSLEENPAIDVEYIIEYHCEGEAFYVETITDTLQGEVEATRIFFAKDFSPAYQLNDTSSKTATVSYNNPSTTIVFNYDYLAGIEAIIDYQLSGERLRPDNIIAAGYGIQVNASVDITTGFGSEFLQGEPKLEVVWLEEQPYEWVFDEVYEVSNVYPMDHISGSIDNAEFELAPNADSNFGSRKFFTPVELPDGDYEGIIRYSGVQYPLWSVNDVGEVISNGYQELIVEEIFTITIDGTMYDDFNVIT